MASMSGRLPSIERDSSVGGKGISGSSTRAGIVAVKDVPWPASLTTVMSPPMSWQNLRLIARPSPVPPYLRVVEASACTNA